MEAVLGVFIALSLITSFWAVNATRHSIRREAENVRLTVRNRELQMAGEVALQALSLLQKKAPPPAQFDQQTTSLIRLAISNPNENEARSAAVQACKRLYKQLPK
jgi:hypothetical protein